MSEVRTAKTTVELPLPLHRKLRVKAAVEDRTINAVLVECVQTCLGDFQLDPSLLEVETRPPPPQSQEEKDPTT